MNLGKQVGKEVARRRGAVPYSLDGELVHVSLFEAATSSDPLHDEVSAHLQESRGLAPGGLGPAQAGGVHRLLPPRSVLPWIAPGATRLDTVTGGKGASGRFETPHLLDGVYARAAFQALGGIVTDAPGIQSWVVRTSPVTVAFREEDPDTDQPDSALGLSSIRPPAVSLGGTTGFTRLVDAANVVGLRQLVERDLRAVAAAVIDAAALGGTGEDNQPTGIAHADGVAVVETGGMPPTYSDIVDLEEAPSLANADRGPSGFAATPAMRRALRLAPVLGDTAAGPTWRGGFMLGHRAEVSNNVPSNLGPAEDQHAVIYSGDWSRGIVNIAAFEIITDPYSLKKRGVIEVTLFAHLQVAVVEPGAFAVIADALPVSDS